MALNKQYLALVGPDGNSEAGRLWRYKTEDALAVVDGAGYFNGVADLLAVADSIHVTVVTNIGASNEAVSDAGQVVVLSNDGTIVDTSDETAITVTDTD